MKNLRKVLALVLVVAMMASLVISASALSAKDYTDYSEVVNKDAVAMLTELGIINGYPAGDFQPAGIVTRAEMAKMIYVVLNSGNDQAPAPDAQRYSDVYKGHWAEGYVAFCDDLGIIDGMGDGTFAPSAPVTGVQAAKMLLVAMGYDSAVEGFTGTNWDYGVLKAASAAGLFEGFTASVNEGCTRDNAALLVYNALIGDCVSYVGNTAVATGDTLIGTCYGLVAVTGVVVANEYANLFGTEPLMAGKTEIAFIGDQYSDLVHAIDPVIQDWLTWNGEVNFNTWTENFLEELYDENNDGDLGWIEDEINFADWVEVKAGVNDADEYDAFVFSVDTSLAQVGKTVTVYAKLKGNYEQFTNIVEYAKYDMFSGKVVGNVVENDDCVIFYNEGAAGDFSGEFAVDYTTRYFENYNAVWYQVDGNRVYAYDDNAPTSAPADLDFYFEEMTEAVRGEYLWAIDNDGDGVAEIVLKYRQIFAVANYDKYDDEWTFDAGATGVSVDQRAWFEDYSDIPADAVVFDGEELKEGMKVLVVPVDGTYYVKEAASVKAAATEVFYNKEDKEWAVDLDGTKYFESGLYWADDIELLPQNPPPAPDAKQFYAWINEMDPNSGDEYICYLDDFGNIVAYEIPSGPPSDAYFLVTGAAYDVKALNVTDSIVFGAKAAKELTTGVGGYYAAREGRANTVIDDVAPLFDAKANSTDMIATNIYTYDGGLYQYVSYENVFNCVNIYNNSATGLWTNLVKAEFDEEDVLTVMNSVAPDLQNWTTDFSGTTLDGNKIDNKTDKYGNVYVGSDTLFYIYMVDTSDWIYDVITVTGYKNLPTIATTCDVRNVYGVQSRNSADAEVVVIEMIVDWDVPATLPQVGVSNFVYVYDVDSTASGYCQHVYGINEAGELVDLYIDAYDGALPANGAEGWYFYQKTDANTECTREHDHYELKPVTAAGSNGVYGYEYLLKTATLNEIDGVKHDGKYGITMTDSTGAINAWVDLSQTELYIHANVSTTRYNAQECVATNLETLAKNNKYFNLLVEGTTTAGKSTHDMLGNFVAFEFVSGVTADVVYKEGPASGEYEIVAIILQVNCTEAECAEMAGRLEVAEEDSTAAPPPAM